MNLLEVISNLKRFNDEHTIYAQEPWTVSSLSQVEYEPDEGEPEAVSKLNMSYFLEVDLAIEFLEGWLDSVGSKPSPEDVCNRLIEYAVNDS
ncbi:MAG: hypothetical protein GY938_16490 [Ketobacter sp.]|nr:hypothetical protein [Ketobacter sp.]